jgi:hypothetical protein
VAVGVDEAGDRDAVGGVDDLRIVGRDRGTDRCDLAPIYQNVSALKVADVRGHRYNRRVANKRSRHVFLPGMDVFLLLMKAGFASISSSGTTASVSIGDRQLFGWEERDYRAACVGDNDLFLDAGHRIAIGRRAIGLEREHHAGFDLHRSIERD